MKRRFTVKKSDKELEDICIRIYNRMYLEAEPSANFEFLVKTYLGTDKGQMWKYDYYLRMSRQLGIIEVQCNSAKCSRIERAIIEHSVLDGLAPSNLPTKVKSLEELRRHNA